MNTLATETTPPCITDVRVDGQSLSVELSDGRALTAPTAWYPRLLHATAEERSGWVLIGGGQSIHWESIDEDISVENLLAGKPSGESQASLKRWLATRSQ